MSSMREYEEKKLAELKEDRICYLIDMYASYLHKLDRTQIDKIYNSDSFELGARRV